MLSKRFKFQDASLLQMRTSRRGRGKFDQISFWTLPLKLQVAARVEMELSGSQSRRRADRIPRVAGSSVQAPLRRALPEDERVPAAGEQSRLRWRSEEDEVQEDEDEASREPPA